MKKKKKKSVRKNIWSDAPVSKIFQVFVIFFFFTFEFEIFGRKKKKFIFTFFCFCTFFLQNRLGKYYFCFWRYGGRIVLHSCAHTHQTSAGRGVTFFAAMAMGCGMHFHWPMHTYARRKPDKNERLGAAEKLYGPDIQPNADLSLARNDPSCQGCIEKGAVQGQRSLL